MRIALITDPKRMDCPESIKKIYDKSLQQVTGCIVEAIKSLEHEVKHIIAKTDLQDKLIKFNPNLVFNRSNSIDPRSGFSATPTLLDKLQIPYTGPNAKKCVVAMNKFQTKNILKKLSIPTPKYILIDSANDIHIPEDMSFPLFIKVIKGGCSLGIERENLVFDKEQCNATCTYLIKNFNQPVIIEEYLEGREFTVGVMGNKHPKVLPILEFINISKEEYQFRSFSTKMIVGKYEKKSCPAFVSKRIENEIIDLSLKTYIEVGCRDYARIDIRLDKYNQPQILEVNAFPSLIPNRSSFGLMAKAAGLSFEELIKIILGIACKRHQSN